MSVARNIWSEFQIWSLWQIINTLLNKKKVVKSNKIIKLLQNRRLISVIFHNITLNYSYFKTTILPKIVQIFLSQNIKRISNMIVISVKNNNYNRTCEFQLFGKCQFWFLARRMYHVIYIFIKNTPQTNKYIHTHTRTQYTYISGIKNKNSHVPKRCNLHVPIECV